MNLNDHNIKSTNSQWMQYALLGIFTLFCLYFCISSYRFYQLNANDLATVTDKVEQIAYKRAKGKQAKPEVWVNLAEAGRYRIAYGNNNLLSSMTTQIQKGDLITIYLKKPQHGFLNFGMDEDILQITKGGQVVYSLDIPHQRYHGQFLASALICLLLPLMCFLYWDKAKKNDMVAAMKQVRRHHQQVSVV